MMNDPIYRMRTFLGATILLLAASVLGYYIGGVTISLLFSLPILAIALILKRSVESPLTGEIRVRLASLAAVCGLTPLLLATQQSWTFLLLPPINWLYSKLGITPLTETPLHWAISGPVLICATVVVLNAIWSRSSITIAPSATNNDSGRMPNQDYEAALLRYCQALNYSLDRIDRESNWSDADLTPLEAEVEMERKGRTQTVLVRNLVDAIRRDRRTELFVVIGEPGSGKSVSLRRLCRLLCDQAQQTGVIPVYANLRSMRLPTGQRIPTETDIRDFAMLSARDYTGRDGRALLDSWYDGLRGIGRLFFIFDSFDEMPSVLDTDNVSEEHKSISLAFDKFFFQEAMSCRGIIASREFKQPIGLAGRRLFVRPFRNWQIRIAMRKWFLGRGIAGDEYMRRLFRDRSDLTPLLRNPFTAELLAQYAIHNGDLLPTTAFDLFDDFVRQRLRSEATYAQPYGLSEDELLEAASRIASLIFRQSDISLEIGVDEVRRAFSGNTDEWCNRMLSVLRVTRLARVNHEFGGTIAFVHRRFAELFAVRALRQEASGPSLDAIQDNSSWRDGLVLYAGIATPAEANRILCHCADHVSAGIEHLKEGRLLEARPAVHSLRFVIEAFRANHASIESGGAYRLRRCIYQLTQSTNPFGRKLAAEGLPLLSTEQMAICIPQLVSHEIPWITQTVIDSCRHLASVPVEISKPIRSYVREMEIEHLWDNFTELNFSFSLSDGWKSQRRRLWCDMAQTILLTILAIASGIAVISFSLSAILVVLNTYFLFMSCLLPTWLFAPEKSSGIHVPYLRPGLNIFFALFVAVCTSWAISSQVQLTTTYSYPILMALSFVVGAIVCIVCSLTWDAWPDFFYFSREAKKYSVLRVCIFVIGLCFISVSVFYVLLMCLGYIIVILLGIIFGTAIGTRLAALLFTLLGVYYVSFPQVREMYREFLDRRALGRYGVPRRLQVSVAVSNLQKLLTSNMRQQYLRDLVAAKTELVGDVHELPQEINSDPRVVAELFRLKAQTLHLE